MLDSTLISAAKEYFKDSFPDLDFTASCDMMSGLLTLRILHKPSGSLYVRTLDPMAAGSGTLLEVIASALEQVNP